LRHAESSWKAGFDVLSLGVIKNAGMNSKAVVFFDPTRAGDFEFRCKPAGHLAGKGKYAARNGAGREPWPNP
jgi:threonine aldolase